MEKERDKQIEWKLDRQKNVYREREKERERERERDLLLAGAFLNGIYWEICENDVSSLSKTIISFHSKQTKYL